MKLKLRSMFLCIAVAAVACWCVSLDTERDSFVLVCVAPARRMPLGSRIGTTAKPTSPLNTEFADILYSQILKDLAIRHPELVAQMSHPEKEIQSAIRLKNVRDRGDKSWFVIQAWGNPFARTNRKLDLMMASSLNSLETLKETNAAAWELTIIEQ